MAGHEEVHARPARPKVLICAKGYPPDVGGVQTYSEYLARAYAKAGLEPVVISSRPGETGWLDLDYPEGKVRLFNVGQGQQTRLFFRMLVSARRILAAERFAFLHPTTWRPALALAPWWRRHIVLLTVHGQEVLSTPRPLVRPMRWALRTADVVAAVSRPTLMAARSALAGGKAKGDWFAVHNGLSYAQDAAAYARPARPNGPVRIYSFSRLAERKNIEGGLRALRMLRDRGIENFDYVIGGGGPLKERIAALIGELGLSDKVRMAGYIEEADIPERYKACDIFLHPQTAPRGGTDLEGFGLAIADAMSFGALAIVGEAGGPADFVTNEENGLVVDGAQVTQIADALASVLTDEDRLQRIARTGRDWTLAHLSWDRHAAEILKHAAHAGAPLPLS